MEYVSVLYAGQRCVLLWLSDRDHVVHMGTTPELSRALAAPLRDWAGALVSPQDGERFLEAAFDALTLSGWDPRWIYVGRCGLDGPDLLPLEMSEEEDEAR